MATTLKYSLLLKRSRIILILLLFFSFSSSEVHSKINHNILNIYYSGNSHGVLEHCGCPGSKFGGIANRLYFVKHSVNSDNSILLDAGDFFSLNNDSLKNYFAYQILKDIKYDALNIGELDLKTYLDESNNEKFDLPLISTNVSFFLNKRSNIKPFRIINKNGLKIGIIGSIKRDFFNSLDLLEKVSKFDIIKLKKQISNLKNKVDIVIFLSHLEGRNEKALFIENKDIDIMISGHNNILTSDIFSDENRAFVAAGKNSEYFGEISLTWNRFDENSKIKIVSIKNKFHKMMADSIPIDEDTQKLLDEYNNSIAVSILKNNSKKNKYQFYDDKFCIKCHDVKETIHSNAFETIKDRKNKNECYYCHTTGYGSDTGYLPNSNKEEFQNINCSMCHKVNKNTTFDEKDKHNVRFILSVTCKRCHRKPHDMEFNYHEKKKKLMKFHK